MLLSGPVTNGMNVPLAYLSNVDTDVTGSACTNAAPSNTLTSYDSGGDVCVIPLVMQSIRSHFLVEPRLPISETTARTTGFMHEELVKVSIWLLASDV